MECAKYRCKTHGVPLHHCVLRCYWISFIIIFFASEAVRLFCRAVSEALSPRQLASSFWLLVLKFLKSAWSKASCRVILAFGLNCKVFSKKSMASELEPGYLDAKSQRFCSSKTFKYSRMSLSFKKLHSASYGEPITSKIDARWQCSYEDI